MITVECRECEWHASSASDLAELEFVFHHGPDALHAFADLKDDTGRKLCTLRADARLFAMSPAPVRPRCLNRLALPLSPWGNYATCEKRDGHSGKHRRTFLAEDNRIVSVTWEQAPMPLPEIRPQSKRFAQVLAQSTLHALDDLALDELLPDPDET